MDYCLKTENSFNKLLKEYEQYGSLVVAYDFDNTIFDLHHKAQFYDQIIGLLRELKELNCHLIAFTANEDLDFVRDYCRRMKIPFDGINENPPFYVSSSRKIYYNVFLDDRAGLKESFHVLTQLVYHLKNKKLLIESVAEEIHEIRSEWAKSILKNEKGISGKRVIRWESECFLPYKMLSEKMKKHDRTFANRIIHKMYQL